uniref:Uncharacterized protein LOC105122724 n=1 Tax=Rhizophora mucronata TaxID=61149 RepID=A0A2P2JBI1_RHIMU
MYSNELHISYLVEMLFIPNTQVSTSQTRSNRASRKSTS